MQDLEFHSSILAAQINWIIIFYRFNFQIARA